MKTIYNPFSFHPSRIGFHYYPDALHYRESDLQAWLPEFAAMGVNWLLLKSATNRAIPEAFIQGLVQNGIEPVVQFDLSLVSGPNLGEISPILEAYSRWGVKGVLVFDRPNARIAWSASTWAQNNLVEHFLDRYLPIAQFIDNLGMVSILPPLQPAGSYWDTAFLRATLEGMDRRKSTALLDHLVLSCYGWTNQRNLNWGIGGPERWPNARPYSTLANSQDQIGFRGYEWYQSIARSVLKKEVPIILLQVGQPADPEHYSSVKSERKQDEIEAIARLLNQMDATDPSDPQTQLAPLPPTVLAGMLYQLASENQSPSSTHAWFSADGSPSPSVETLKSLAQIAPYLNQNQSNIHLDPTHPIRHYLLLPAFDWGVADWHLDVARPFIKKYRPTVGFSILEAALAQEVTVVGNASAYPEEILDQLRLSGSLVRRVEGIGIEIASELSER